jgi:uracil-DNA glycosylase
MSANSGFFGTRPFSRANRLLESQGGAPVDWKLP